jgi:tetratricopeptide (TPR) repeat protein
MVKEKQIKLVELETILKDKNEISELDKVRKIYYQHIEELLSSARKAFKEKDLENTIEPLSKILKIGFHAYDLDTVLLVLHLRSLVYVYFDSYKCAINDLKTLRRAADELQDYQTKMIAYELMGKCFIDIKEYNYALKCFKKELEISWISNDETSELRAYEMIGKTYFYMGEI